MRDKVLSQKAIQVLRAEEEWQRAGAYSVRIEGMNRQHHIPLKEEFDEHDGPGARYIVLLDDGYPVATCRFISGDDYCPEKYTGLEGLALMGRVVVLPDYRGLGIGARTVREAEDWMQELGYKTVGLDSRVEAVGFYEKLGYEAIDHEVVISGPFECICMMKNL